MKKIVIIALVLVLGSSFLYAENSHAGVSIGGNLAFLSADGFYDSLFADRSPRMGLSVGFYGDYEFYSMKNKLLLSMQPGILYTMKGFRMDNLNVNLDYLEIPVLIKASVPLASPANLYLLMGPSLGINVVRESEIGTFTSSSDDKRTDFGIVIGAGVDFEANIAVDIRANFGLVNIIDSDSRNQNHSVALMVSYAIL